MDRERSGEPGQTQADRAKAERQTNAEKVADTHPGRTESYRKGGECQEKDMGCSEGQQSRQTAASIKNVPVSKDCWVRSEQRCWRRGEGRKGLGAAGSR